MKRLIFYFLLLGCIAGSSLLILFLGFGVTGSSASGATMFDYLQAVFEMVKNGTWPWSNFSAAAVFTYTLVLFLFINVVLLFSLLVMALTTLFKFEKVYRFYATATWYLISSIIFTAGVAYLIVQASGSFLDVLKTMPWEFFMPLISSVILVVLGAILREGRDA